MTRLFIQCKICKRSLEKNEITGRFGDLKDQQIDPEATVIWRLCGECRQTTQLIGTLRDWQKAQSGILSASQ
jgi:hypothetical protein